MRLALRARGFYWVCLVTLLPPVIQPPIQIQAAQSITQTNRPTSFTATIGDVLVRIDGPKLWTLSRIEYKGALLGVEDSAYGTVVNIRNVGNLGTAHFLDVPGHPGEVEKEQVNELRFFIDGHPVQDITDTMSVAGKSFRVQRISKIRTFDLDSKLEVRDGVVVQSVRMRTPKAVDLKVTYPLMYAWTPTATEYLFGSDDDNAAGSQKSGAFNPANTKPSEGLEKSVRWMAIYDAPSGKGAVTYLVTCPEKADAWFQFTDAPGVYRKMRLMSFAESTVPAGFDGTYCMVTGFFSSAQDEWKPIAQKRANELKALSARLKEP